MTKLGIKAQELFLKFLLHSTMYLMIKMTFLHSFIFCSPQMFFKAEKNIYLFQITKKLRKECNGCEYIQTSKQYIKMLRPQIENEGDIKRISTHL